MPFKMCYLKVAMEQTFDFPIYSPFYIKFIKEKIVYNSHELNLTLIPKFIIKKNSFTYSYGFY